MGNGTRAGAVARGHLRGRPGGQRAPESERERHLRLAAGHRRHVDVWALLTAISALTVVGLVLVPFTLGGCLVAARRMRVHHELAASADLPAPAS